MRTGRYTDDDITAAWDKFIDLNPGEHLLINAMRMARPVRLSGDTFSVAQSKIHLGYIHEGMPRIRRFVRDKVMNDSVEFVLNEVSEDSPLAWNDRELVRHIVENNPAVGEFINALKLSIL